MSNGLKGQKEGRDLDKANQIEIKPKKSLTRAGLSLLVLTTLLGACDEINANIPVEPTPITADYNDPEQTTETDILDETEDASLLPTEATAELTPEKPLEIEFSGTSQLDQETKDNLDEQTSEFMTATTNSINNNPELKAALYIENGLKIVFDPSHLIYHNGMWGYFAPEGGPLSNNLLIISNAEDSKGEIRFCSIDGAASALGLNLNEQDYYLDFDNVSGQNVCLVRKDSDNSVVAINNAQGQWSLPENSGLKMLTVSPSSARADGLTAVEVAQEETKDNTTTPETIEFPRDINPIYKVNADNLEFMDWGEGYVTKGWRIYIRSQDLHLNEPFTMLDGRYYVQAWADAWFMESGGTGHHISVPLWIFDTEKFQLWGLFGFQTWPNAVSEDSQEILIRQFTSPFDESDYAKYILDEALCFTETGNRDCGSQNPYDIDIGYIPNKELYSTKYQDGLQSYVEFLEELLQEIYTKDNVEAYWQTFDPNLLQLDEPNLPKNFIIPLRTGGG